jgi:hypothetical protein
MGARFCDEPDCLRVAVRGGKCRGHYARVERGRRSSAPVRERLNPREALFEAVYALADADAESEAAYRAARERFLYHGRRFFRPACGACKGCGKGGGG